MASAVEQLGTVRGEDRRGGARGEARRPAAVTLVAVSKTFDADAIRPVIEAGQRVFGENRVQEAQGKWPALKAEFPDIELHLIGPLQSNKAKEAVALFDVIETVDREKIAAELAKEIARQGQIAKALRPGQHRLGAAEGRHRAARGVAFVDALPRGARPADRRADVHPAGRRKSRAAFRAAGEAGARSRRRKAVDGHVRRLRDWRSPSARPASGSARRSSAAR